MISLSVQQPPSPSPSPPPPPPPPPAAAAPISQLGSLSEDSVEAASSRPSDFEEELEKLLTRRIKRRPVDKAIIWNRYRQKLKENQGFDIEVEDYPGWPATIYPMRCYLGNPHNYAVVKGRAEKALEVYNKRKCSNYEVKDVLKLTGGGTGCGDFHYYITFSTTTPHGKGNDFQALVVVEVDDSLRIPIVRQKRNEVLDTSKTNKKKNKKKKNKKRKNKKKKNKEVCCSYLASQVHSVKL